MNIIYFSQLLSRLNKRGASFRWLFGPLSAWGSVVSTIILTTHLSLPSLSYSYGWYITCNIRVRVNLLVISYYTSEFRRLASKRLKHVECSEQWQFYQSVIIRIPLKDSEWCMLAVLTHYNLVTNGKHAYTIRTTAINQSLIYFSWMTNEDIFRLKSRLWPKRKS